MLTFCVKGFIQPCSFVVWNPIPIKNDKGTFFTCVTEGWNRIIRGPLILPRIALIIIYYYAVTKGQFFLQKIV